jgi:hypothetical protein
MEDPIKMTNIASCFYFSMNRLSFASLLFLVVFLLAGCHHKSDLSIAPPFPSQSPWLKCSKDTIYFQNSVLPVVINSCGKSGCHDAGSNKHELVLDNYSSIYNLVTPNDPVSSRLYTVLFSFGQQKMPPGDRLSVNQESLIYYWILQGAVNNRCEPAGCDSSHVTYDSIINPIVQSWCTGCHGGSTPAYGISLTTYDQVKLAVSNGRFMGAIRQETGFYPMPKGSQLSPCDIALFQIWINKGMPK